VARQRDCDSVASGRLRFDGVNSIAEVGGWSEVPGVGYSGGSPSPQPSPARGEGVNLCMLLLTPSPLSPCGRGAGGEGGRTIKPARSPPPHPDPPQYTGSPAHNACRHAPADAEQSASGAH